MSGLVQTCIRLVLLAPGTTWSWKAALDSCIVDVDTNKRRSFSDVAAVVAGGVNCGSRSHLFPVTQSLEELSELSGAQFFSGSPQNENTGFSPSGSAPVHLLVL